MYNVIWPGYTAHMLYALYFVWYYKTYTLNRMAIIYIEKHAPFAHKTNKNTGNVSFRLCAIILIIWIACIFCNDWYAFAIIFLPD